MSRLKALFQKGVMKLTGGKKVIILADNEISITTHDLNKLISESATLSYQKGLKEGANHTLWFPSPKPNDPKLVDVVSHIASELLDQGDVDSCKWLYNKIHQCRSL